MAKTRCGLCDRNFKNEESLAMHNSAVHSSSHAKKPAPEKSKKWIGFAVLAVLVILVGWALVPVIFGSADNSCEIIPAAEMNIRSHTNLDLHIHADVEITIDGIKQIIPAEIGIENGIMRPVHTHDSSGQIHIEAPCVRTFYLKDFFNIWGNKFNKNQILDKTTTEGTLAISVNGQPSDKFEDLELKDGDRILIEFNSF